MKTRVLTIAILALIIFATPSRAQSASDLFQQALVKERTEGDLQAAIVLYERVVSANADRSLSAKALVQIGKSYEKLGLTEAVNAYQRVLDDYSEQQEIAKIARDRLSLLRAAMAEKEPLPLANGIVKRHVMDIPDNMGKVSPDGRFLSFVEWNSGNVGILDLETGEETLVNSDGRAAVDWMAFGDVSIWSPDGKELMYLWLDYRESGGAGEVRIYNRETGQTRVLVPFGSDEVPFPVTWFDDGNQLLAINDRDVHITDAITLVNTETASTRVVTTLSENWHTFRMDVSPDNKHIVYETFRTGQARNRTAPSALGIISTDGSGRHTLLDNNEINHSPTWAKDGKHVLYLRSHEDTTELWAQGVENGRAAGQPRLVYSGLGGDVGSLGIADDGRYFYSQESGEENVYEQGVNLETGEMNQNMRVISSVRYGNQRVGVISPNGDWFAFVSDRPGVDFSLVITHLVTGETKILEMPVGRVQGPFAGLNWSADNTSLLVMARDNSVASPRPIYVSIDAQDGSLVELLELDDFGAFGDQEVAGLGSSADGKRVFVSSKKLLVEFDIASKSHRVIREFEDADIVMQSLSPDRRTIAVTLRRDNSSDSGLPTIELVSISDGSISTVDKTREEQGYSGLVRLSWTPDGKNIVFAENRPNNGQQLYTLNVASGKRTAIGEPAFGGDDGYRFVQVHPAGDKLTFYKRTSKLQLWVLDGIEL